MRKSDLPNDGVPTFGWTYHSWTGPRRSCVKCGRRRRRGVVSLNDLGREEEEDFRFLCSDCDRYMREHEDELREAEEARDAR